MASIPLEELKRELDALERGSFAALSDDNLREKVKQIHEGLSIQAPIVPADKLIFRAVKVTQLPGSKQRISYPPPEVVRTLDMPSSEPAMTIWRVSSKNAIHVVTFDLSWLLFGLRSGRKYDSTHCRHVSGLERPWEV
jgi:hypothetical protein